MTTSLQRFQIATTLFFCTLQYIAPAQHTEVNCFHAKRFEYSQQTNLNTFAGRTSAGEDYDVTFYFLDIEADNTSIAIHANVEMKARSLTSVLSTIIVDLSSYLTVDSAFVNNVKADFTHENDEVAIFAPSSVSEGQFFTTRIFYHGTPSTGGFFSGISNGFSQTFGTQATWTLSEPLNAKDWFACKQVLTDKADSADIFITVPSHLKAGSNGLLTNITDLPDNKKRFEWKTRYPIAYYLISMAIADYQEYNTTATVNGKEILIQNFLYNHPDVLPSFQDDLDEVSDMLVYFSDAYGTYPFADEKYGHAMAPFGGGMEHQTMSTMGTFNFTLDAHELGHQWFGDNVTCATWQDIWINEGFARYSEYLALEQFRSEWEIYQWLEADYNNVLKTPSGSVYVPAESATDENRIFDFRLTYSKGGALLHMIRNIVNNDEVFFETLQAFQKSFKDSVATGDDFKAVLEETSGMDFSDFFNEWYYGEGYPIYKAHWNHDADTLYIALSQTTSTTTTPFFHNPVDIRVNFEDGSFEIRRVLPTEAGGIQKLYTSSEVQVTGIMIDPERWLLKKVSEITRDFSLTAPEQPVTSLEESLRKTFTFYPNPTSEFLTIETTSTRGFSVEIIDAYGKILSMHESSAPLFLVNTTDVSSGLFLLKISTDKGSFYQKIIKK